MAYKALVFSATFLLIANHADADRVFYDSFESPVVLSGATDPSGWSSGGHPSYLRAANESGSNWSTPYGEQGMSTYSNGIGTRVVDVLGTGSGDYSLKFNVASSANQAEYRAELWADHPFFGRSLLAFVTGDTDGSKDMSFSDQLAWRYEYDPTDDFNLSGAQLEIKLMQDPARSNWRHTPIWDNVSLDFVPDVDTSPPTLVDAVDDRDGGTVAPDSIVTYTVSFSEAMDASTVDPSDFGNASSSTVIIESVASTPDETVFIVAVRPTDEGLLRLRINEGAVLNDVAGNPMNTSSAIQDNVTITVDATNPILLPSDFVDDQGGNTVRPNTLVVYTLTFSKDMTDQSVTASDFGNAGTAPFMIGTISETSPTSGVFTMEVTPTGSGTLQLKVNAGALLLDEEGGSLNTSAALADDTTITVDGIPPTLVPSDITDDQGGNSVAVGTLVTYTLFFSEPMDPSTVDAADFGNAGDAPFTISSVGEASPGVFRIELVPDGSGTLRIQINAGAAITDAAGNALDTATAIADDTLITVDDTTPPTLTSTDIDDDRAGAAVTAGALVIYTLTFSEDIDASTVDAVDFGNAGTAHVEIGAIAENSPGVFAVETTPSGTGTLQFQINAGAVIADETGNVLDTSSPIVDDTVITVDEGTGDIVPPTLAASDIVDDQAGGPVVEGTLVTYTLTFSEDIDAATVDASDFSNAGTAPVNIGAIAEISPQAFIVEATPVGTGTLRLQVEALAVIEDESGNPLDTSSAILDDTSIMVESHYASWSDGNAFHLDENGDGVPNGLAWLLGASSVSERSLQRLPATAETSGDLVLTFRCLKSTNRGGASLKIQYSTDLGGTSAWSVNEAEVPDGDSTVNGITFDTTDDGDFINVTATIPASSASPGNKLFARLAGEMP